MLSKAEVVMLGITGTGPPEVVRQSAIDWKEMHDKLEAQLAAEASAVEVREYVTNLLASERQRASGREVPSIDRGFQMALELVRNKFIMCEEAALRAITEAESNSPASEVRE